MNEPVSKKLERRHFVAMCIAGSGAVALGWKLAGSMAPRGPVTREDYLQQLNTVFDITVLPESPAEGSGSAPATAVHVPLKLVKVSDAVVRPADKRRFEAYSILFEGPASSPLQQQTVMVHHPRLGNQELFLVRVGKPEKNVAYYEASFSTYQ
ncbi:MAG TPA: hypothetical protein VEK08_09900 [Planctomycetota bacterium]|nr:hypothetical protein [Planctomycetota bacterium]